MYLVTSNFINIALALTIVFAVVQVCFYFTFKRKANVTDIDKNLWQLRLFSGFLAALIFLAILYLPSTGFYREIDLSPAARETAFQDLVYNQQRIGDQLDQLSYFLFLSNRWSSRTAPQICFPAPPYSLDDQQGMWKNAT